MKKMMRRTVSFTMAMMLLLSVTLGALAADYEAADYSELESAFDGTNNSEGDTTVNVNVTADIDFVGSSLSTKEGWNYNVSSNNGSSLENASFTGGEDGAGTVNISGMDLTGDTGLTASGGVEVTVNNGDVSGKLIGIDSDCSEVTVDGGDVEGGDFGIRAGFSTVEVYGNVTGLDGDPEAVDYDDPGDYSDGGHGIYANGSTVYVSEDVTGGNSYGTYGYGGDAVYADNSKVIVDGNATGGNVTADPETVGSRSQGGDGVYAIGSSTVSVGGNATGGSTNGDSGGGGYGIFIYQTGNSQKSTVTVEGMAIGGQAENGIDGFGIRVGKNDNDVTFNAEITVGSYDSVASYSGFDDEELAEFAASIKVTGIKSDVKPVNMGGEAARDTFWGGVIRQIRAAEKGATVEIDAGGRVSMPATIAEAVKEAGVTLVIRWNGGEDITIDSSFDKQPMDGAYAFKDL